MLNQEKVQEHKSYVEIIVISVLPLHPPTYSHYMIFFHKQGLFQLCHPVFRNRMSSLLLASDKNVLHRKQTIHNQLKMLLFNSATRLTATTLILLARPLEYINAVLMLAQLWLDITVL